MTSDIEKPDRVAAHRRAETIRSGIEGFAASKTAIAEAFDARDWITLGYTSWGDYCKKEVGNKLKLPRADRDLAIEAFHELGMSVREIADALDVAKSTVQDALKPPPPKASGSGQQEPTDPLAAIPAAKDAIDAALANRSTPAEQLEEDRPGRSDLGEVEDPESSAADGADGRLPSDAQPQAGDVSNDAGSDETEAKGEAPRQPSAEVDLPQGQETAGVTVSVPAGDPEHSGRSEEQGQAAASIPAPGLAQLEKLLDEHVPDGDPHRKWRSAWLKAIKNAWGPASFAIADICANGDEDTFAALIDVRDFYDELLTKVQAERLRIAKAEQADLPDNVTPIRRTA